MAWRPIKGGPAGKARRFVNTETGETISLRQHFKLTHSGKTIESYAKEPKPAKVRASTNRASKTRAINKTLAEHDYPKLTRKQAQLINETKREYGRWQRSGRKTPPRSYLEKDRRMKRMFRQLPKIEGSHDYLFPYKRTKR